MAAAHLIPVPIDPVGVNPYTQEERLVHSKLFWNRRTIASLDPRQFNEAAETVPIGGILHHMTMEVDRAQTHKIEKIANFMEIELQTNHLPPVGSAARKAHDEFQLSPCPFPNYDTWQQLTTVVTDLIYVAVQKVPDNLILNTGTLAAYKLGAANIKKHYKTMSQNLLALILFQGATNSWWSPISKLESLRELQQGILEESLLSKIQQQDVFYHFVNPLLALAITYMNPKGYLNYEKTLSVSCHRSITDVAGKAKRYGVWVSKSVHDRIVAGDICMTDQNLCKGVEYSFYHLFQLLAVRQIPYKR
jgi:hypothetical protein